jgi:anaerobic magnesium-protoporphyrin IX monomethyl ester cyclase
MSSTRWKRTFDVLLVQPAQGDFVHNRIFEPGVEIPLNLTCLAAYLEQAHKIHTEILDLRLYDDPHAALRDVMEKYRFSIIGISAHSSEIENGGKVAHQAKKYLPHIPIVVGGHHASAVPRETLSLIPAFDYLIQGEGERSFAGFVQGYFAGDDLNTLRGLAYRSEGGIQVNPHEELIADLDQLPLTAREKIDMGRYQPKPATGNFLRLPSTGIMASRGCPFACAYCSKGVWHRSLRFRSPENVVREIESCIEHYGTYDFRFYDDALTSPSWDLSRFCSLLLNNHIRISWNCYSRVDQVNEEKLRLMKQAGCYHIKYGVEFGTEKALRLSRKNTTLEQARRAIELTKKAGIECKASFIFGIPGETEEDCEHTLGFALELSPDLASFYPFDLFPGSLFHRTARKDFRNHVRITLPRAVTERITRKAYYRFYCRPRYVWQRGKKILRHPKRELLVLSDGLRLLGRSVVRTLLRPGGHKASSGGT